MKNKELSVKHICEFIWDLESKHDLLNWQINGVYVWALIRFKVYLYINENTGLCGSAHPNIKKTIKEKIIIITKSLYYYLFRNPFFSRKKVKNILIPHSRKINGEDIYSNQLMKELADDVMVIDSFPSPIREAYILDFHRLTNILKVKIRSKFYKLSDENIKKILILENEINGHWGLNINLEKMIVFYFLKFRFDYVLYKKLFNEIEPKNLYLVVSYLKPQIIAAAKDLGINIVELQHGIITHYHMGYSYPAKNNIQYFPNELWCFGKYWYESTILPKNVKCRVVGAAYLYDYIRKYKGKKENNIVFMSQGLIGKRLFEVAVETASLLPEYKIIFKLHPSEISEDYKKLYDQYKIHPDNFVILGKEKNVYELLISSKYQVGVSSTSLFEGIVFGNIIIIVNLPSLEYMGELRKKEKNNLLIVKNAKELVSKLKMAKKIKFAEYYYHKPISKITSEI